jgi:hypothetical protein
MCFVILFRGLLGETSGNRNKTWHRTFIGSRAGGGLGNSLWRHVREEEIGSPNRSLSGNRRALPLCCLYSPQKRILNSIARMRERKPRALAWNSGRFPSGSRLGRQIWRGIEPGGCSALGRNECSRRLSSRSAENRPGGGCLLMKRGMNLSAAIDSVSAARGVSVPETAQQRHWLERYAPRVFQIG